MISLCRARLTHPLLRILMVFTLFPSGFTQAETTEKPPEKATYASLADILEDDQARARLIAELRQLAEAKASAETGSTATEAEAEAEAEQTSFARQIADQTLSITQQVVTEFSRDASALTTLWNADEEINAAATLGAAIRLGLVIAATLGLFLLLRGLIRPLFSRANTWATQADIHHSITRRTGAVVGTLLLDLAAILIAWVGGYVLALFVIGNAGAMDALQSLFLNAFLMVEAVKTVFRMLFAAKYNALRLLPLSAEDGAYWNAWLARLSGFIGYGLLFLAPAISLALSPSLGRLATLLILLIAFLYALLIILQNRAPVSARLLQQAQDTHSGFARVLYGILARCWYVLAIGYLAVMTLVTLARPEDALPLMLKSTLQTLVAIGGGAFLSALLTQVISRPIRIPDQTKLRFPLLEQRLNGFIPAVLKVVRIVIVVAVVAVLLDAWHLFNLTEWLGSEAGARAVGTLVTVGVILIAAMAVWIAFASWIEHRLNPEASTLERSAREKTLLAIFRSAVAVTLSIMTVMIVLAEIGINIGPLIAGAGVLGLAIGFGAQKLVQDIITGVFIQMEDAINTGDIVTAAGITGTAEKLSIRSLGIRDMSGTYHLIPFSSVDTVSNYMRGFAYHVGEYGVAYRENTDDVIVRLREAFDELVADPEQRAKVVGDLEVHGVTALADSSVNIRVRIKTLPGMQWAIGREYNRLVKRHLDAAGIEIPFPHLTLFFGQNKDGTAPPAPIQVVRASTPAQLSQPEAPARSKANPQALGDFDEDSQSN